MVLAFPYFGCRLLSLVLTEQYPSEGIGEEEVLRGIDETFVAMSHVEIDHAIILVCPDNGYVAADDDVLDTQGVVLR